VLHRVREAGATIMELELEPPDLEEVFLRVMRTGETDPRAAGDASPAP